MWKRVSATAAAAAPFARHTSDFILKGMIYVQTFSTLNVHEQRHDEEEAEDWNGENIFKIIQEMRAIKLYSECMDRAGFTLMEL